MAAALAGGPRMAWPWRVTRPAVRPSARVSAVVTAMSLSPPFSPQAVCDPYKEAGNSPSRTRPVSLAPLRSSVPPLSTTHHYISSVRGAHDRTVIAG